MPDTASHHYLLQFDAWGGAAWTPASATSDGGVSPHTWYYAGQLTASDDDPVASMTNQGSDSHSITQGTGAAQPTYKASILNGEPVLRYDGGDSLAGAFTAALTQPLTVFAVAQLGSGLSADSNTYIMFDGNDSTNRVVLYKNGLGAPKPWSVFAGSVQTGGGADENWNVWCFEASGATSEVWQNGVTEIDADAGTRVLDGLTLGAQFDATNRWNGDIAEIVIYDSALSVADKNEVGTYLADKYGLTWSDIV